MLLRSRQTAGPNNIERIEQRVDNFEQPEPTRCSIQVIVYHGPKRNLKAADLRAADVVITTYSVLESDYRKNVLPLKARESTEKRGSVRCARERGCGCGRCQSQQGASRIMCHSKG